MSLFKDDDDIIKDYSEESNIKATGPQKSPGSGHSKAPRDFKDPKAKENRKVIRVPQLAQSRADRPNFLSPTRFVDLDLPKSLMDGLDVAGYFCATPVQAQVIP
ncbi:MAG: hypothetical protein LBF22_13015, partial [Deltaproteobacteria bacterium]|nr:hypothetical protein [Deltaproteobacteria bacterium]